MSWLMIEPGWTVEAADAKEVGTVDEVLGDQDLDIFDGLAVSPGRLKRTRYVPAELIGEIVEGRITLTLPADGIERLGEYVPK